MTPPVGKQRYYAIGADRASQKSRLALPGASGSHAHALTTAGHAGEGFSAAVVGILIFASTALSLYDLYLLHTFLGR